MRENIVAAVEPVLAMGVGAVSLDLEPYPQSRGFVLLLEELDTAFARRGFDGRLSVVAPATAGRWSPAYMASHRTRQPGRPALLRQRTQNGGGV